MATRRVKKSLGDYKLDELTMLYQSLNEVCAEFSRMTDRYSLATGDSDFSDIPPDIRLMIQDRQRFFAYRQRVGDALRSKLTSIMESIE